MSPARAGSRLRHAAEGRTADGNAPGHGSGRRARVAGFRITGTKEAGIFLPTSVNAPKTSVAARVNGDSELARRGCSFCHDSDRFAHRGSDSRDRASDRSDRYVASLALIVAACLLAAWILATRAARLDPMQTLRQESSRTTAERLRRN